MVAVRITERMRDTDREEMIGIRDLTAQICLKFTSHLKCTIQPLTASNTSRLTLMFTIKSKRETRKKKDVEKNNNTESQIEIMRRTGREEQKKKEMNEE